MGATQSKPMTASMSRISPYSKQSLSSLRPMLRISSYPFSGKYEQPKGSGYCIEKTETRAKARFSERVAVVTGSSGGFGLACVKRLAGEGCNVAMFDYDEEKGWKDAQKLTEEFPGVTIKFYPVDITNENVVNTAVEKVANDFGCIHYLFNNAGIQGNFTKLQDYDVSNFRQIMDVNVTGTFIVLKAVSNQMIKQNPQGGSIVNTASMAAHSGPPNMIAYGSSKSAVFHMTRIAAKDLAPCNIRVNSVSPAYIGPGFMWSRQIELQSAAKSDYYDIDPNKTAQQLINSTPLKRYGSIDEVIGPVLFLLSDDASYLNGVDIQITGGMN